MMEKLSLSAKKLSLLLLTLVLLLGSCSRAPSPSEFRTNAFCADLEYITEQCRICATVRVEVPREDANPLPRNVTLTFTFPEALDGLTLTRNDGDVFYEYEELSYRTDTTELLRCVDLLLAEHSKNTEEDSYEILFSEDTGAPQKIVTAKETLYIQNFESIAADD